MKRNEISLRFLEKKMQILRDTTKLIMVKCSGANTLLTQNALVLKDALLVTMV
jgi:hypothetical protein